MRPQQTLQTERLILRQFRPTDAGQVQRLAGDEDVATTTMSVPHPYEDGMAEQWIATHQEQWSSGAGVSFAIELLDAATLIGSIGLVIRPEHQLARLGYWIGKAWWGQGYCTEAAWEVVRFAFEELSLNRVSASHFKRNPASGRVMEKIGMKYEGCSPQQVRHRGRFEDLKRYGLLKTDFEASR